MNRKDALKLIAGIGVGIFLPFGLSSFFNDNTKSKIIKKKLVGFGGAAGKIINQDIINDFETIYVGSNSIINKNVRNINVHDFSKEPKKQDFSNRINLPDELKKIFLNNNNFVLVAGLGGVLGSHLILKSAKYLKENNKSFIVVCSLPFRFEGDLSNTLARKILNDLNNIQKCRFIDLENIPRQYGGKVTVYNAFKIANKQIIEKIYQKN